MAELLVILDPKATGRADCVRGEVCVVKPDGWPWTKLERHGFLVLSRPDMTVAEAEAVYLQDGVPDEVRRAAGDEWQRVAGERESALAAAKDSIAASRRATIAATEAAFDAGTLLVEPLTPDEKATLEPGQQKALVVERIADKAEVAAVEQAVRGIDLDTTKLVPSGVYPDRLRFLDVDALLALGDKVTPLDVDLATNRKTVP